MDSLFAELILLAAIVFIWGPLLLAAFDFALIFYLVVRISRSTRLPFAVLSAGLIGLIATMGFLLDALKCSTADIGPSSPRLWVTASICSVPILASIALFCRILKKRTKWSVVKFVLLAPISILAVVVLVPWL